VGTRNGFAFGLIIFYLFFLLVLLEKLYDASMALIALIDGRMSRKNISSFVRKLLILTRRTKKP